MYCCWRNFTSAAAMLRGTVLFMGILGRRGGRHPVLVLGIKSPPVRGGERETDGAVLRQVAKHAKMIPAVVGAETGA